jgi:DNA-binding NtrC family response regulator
VQLPALRDQEGDIRAWADHFRVNCARQLGIDAPVISAASWTALERHRWPGNMRELQQRIEIAVVATAGSGIIEPAHLGFVGRPGSSAPAASDEKRSKPMSSNTDVDAVNALEEMEKRHIYTVLDRCQWNRGNAADLLGISIRTLRNKLKEYGKGEANESPNRQP